MRRRKEMQDKAKQRLEKEEPTVWFNSLRKRIKKSEITPKMLEIEEEFSEYLITNDYK